MQQKTNTVKIGLRWSPLPMKQYLSNWNLGPGVASLHSRFTGRPDVWNLTWISAGGCERPPYLTANQLRFLADAAQATADAVVGGRLVGEACLSLMPGDFAAFIEQHPKEASELALAKMLAPHWLWVIRDRASLFYEARKSEHGLTVRAPLSQGETILNDSSNIVAFFKFKQPGRRSS